MSASLKMKFGALAAGLSCLLAGYVVAQQREQATGQPGTGQLNRPAAQQLDRPATQPGQAAQPGQPYTAQFRGTQGTAGGQEKQLEHYLANCLLIKNQAEIELSQFAQQKAQSPEVKEFAQQLIRDHQQLSQKLQTLAGGQSVSRTSQTTGARSQFDAPGRQPTNQPEPQNTREFGQERNQSATAERSTGQSGPLNELLALDRQITERCQEMVREELQAKSGPEFDQCFVGAQIGNHVHMLAALEVIGQKAQGELQQVAQEAQPIVQKHLDHAKQLAKAQHSGSQTGGQAERQPGRTQR